ncbi:MAG: carboxymuconolactone decarboxylase family protein [Alphaproteobacteria bacterium]|nr:carboxymuconolactone decarboxylase family protein [Alphaproteobacteria bacterium]
MSRLKPLHPKDMTPTQRSYYDSIMNRPNNQAMPKDAPLTGPFHAWQRSPAFAEKLAVLEQYIRKDGLLEPRLLELATIVVGRIWSAEIVFGSHGPAAVAAGIHSDIVEAIRRRETPAFEKADEAAVYHFTHQLTTEYEVDDATYQAALDVLGEAALVELIGLAGLYVTASMTLNTFRIPVRPGMERPYPDKA